MPYVNIKTTVSVSPEKETALREGCFGVISDCLHKSKDWVMVCVEDNCRLSLGGKTGPFAIAEVRNAGPLTDSQCRSMSSAFSSLLTKELRIPAANSYITFGTPTAWGWNGIIF